MAASAPVKLDIPAAKLLSSRDHVVPGPLLVTELYFQVPLDYARPDAGTITLFARRAIKHERPIFPPDTPPSPKPYMVYLEGGPGFGNRTPQDHSITRVCLDRGYQVLLLDHRGTGMSTPVSTDMLAAVSPDPAAQASYLGLMRQDNTVRDCEAVRKCLTEGLPAEKTAWSIFGQSYGGFVSLSYLSIHPEGLREVFLTGGLAPVGKPIEEVYSATLKKTIERNEQYYKKFPEDIQAVRQLAAYIGSKGSVPMPSGGKLTVPLLLTIGIAFGGHNGFDSVHDVILRLKTSLDQFGFFTRESLQAVENFNPLDSHIIYAILHEAIYCEGPGNASNWAAWRVWKAQQAFSWMQPGFSSSGSSSTDPLFFSGELVLPMHFETVSELIPLRKVAEILATTNDWPHVYDVNQLRKNEVPVYAAVYVEDMYVEYQLSKDTANLVKGTKTFETNIMYHSAIRSKSNEVLTALFNLRDDVLD